MLRPTRLTDAHGPITCVRHSCPSSAVSRSSAAPSSVLACGSSDTVTLVSEVDTWSTERPWRLNTWKASARNPTSCHMPGLSSETSVMPFLMHTALTCAAPSVPPALMCVPSSLGVCVANTHSGMPPILAGRMQRGCSTLAPLLAISCASS
ncbi:MAG: hypothetical protein U1F06_00095 [Steroidobacteraceae bacterium]